ncbi:MAG: DUF1576 domain-containing protein [Eubacteriales bacterium]|nr:DUF1576 domain-containing protein [Eubacteriales bacterium]
MPETKLTNLEKIRNHELSDSAMVDLIAIYITLMMYAASFIAAHYMSEWGTVLDGWHRIITNPCPLVTDYYMLGGLSATFLNAALCGTVCVTFMVCLKGRERPNALAGYFLVIAHCFYGLNLLNMLPCFLAPMLYFRVKKLNVNDNLHVCMFATCFGPFISEFLFRYTTGNFFYIKDEPDVTLLGVMLAIGFALVIGFVIPAILPGAKAWHKGFNLFNGGLAFGIFGFFAYNLFYTTFGFERPAVLTYSNRIYNSFNNSYTLFVNVFFFILFGSLLLLGFIRNNFSLKGYDRLLDDTGHLSSFLAEFSKPLCLINMGFYGIMFLVYVNLVMSISEGVGFTGPTTGVIFAAMTFSLLGQHPRNVAPILFGFLGLYGLNIAIRYFTGVDPGWTISSQSYINAAAFATGVCPITGRYGYRAGFAAGVIDAILCRSTSTLHGGLVLYNGGFTAGLTVLILLPILEHYVTEKNISNKQVGMEKFIVVEERRQKKKKQS